MAQHPTLNVTEIVSNETGEIIIPERIFHSDKDIILTDTVWDDLRVPASNTSKGASRTPDFEKVIDDGSGSQGIWTEVFSSTSEEELFFTTQLPHSWKFGSALYAHVHWLPTASGAGKVSWGLEYSVKEIGEPFSDSIIAYGNVSTPDENPVLNTHYLTPIVEIDMTGITSVSPMILCRIFRDATGTGLTDDFADDVALLEIDFHYEIDTLGSTSEYIK